MKARHLLVYLAVEHRGDWDDILMAIALKEPVDFKDVEMAAKAFKEDDYITLVDENYPDELKTLERPPFVLFRNGKETTEEPPLTIEEVMGA